MVARELTGTKDGCQVQCRKNFREHHNLPRLINPKAHRRNDVVFLLGSEDIWCARQTLF